MLVFLVSTELFRIIASYNVRFNYINVRFNYIHRAFSLSLPKSKEDETLYFIMDFNNTL
jgi:hypothetical protein